MISYQQIHHFPAAFYKRAATAAPNKEWANCRIVIKVWHLRQVNEWDGKGSISPIIYTSWLDALPHSQLSIFLLNNSNIDHVRTAVYANEETILKNSPYQHTQMHHNII